jgi:hypothetical protein
VLPFGSGELVLCRVQFSLFKAPFFPNGQAIKGLSAWWFRAKAKTDGTLAIAKFPRAEPDEWGVAMWERIENELAQRASIDVACAELVRVANRNVLLVDRFDRVGSRRADFASALAEHSETAARPVGPVRILEVMVWSQVEPRGYYRS